MAKQNLQQAIEEITEPVITELNYELVDVEYKKEGSHWYLRLYIDKPDGITVDDCQLVSEHISNLLDERDPIPHGYFLEVSSPGLDRVLKKDSDYERYKGSKVDLSFYKTINGKKKHSGELAGFTDNELTIKSNDEVITFNRADISIVRLAVEF